MTLMQSCRQLHWRLWRGGACSGAEGERQPDHAQVCISFLVRRKRCGFQASSLLRLWFSSLSSIVIFALPDTPLCSRARRRNGRSPVHRESLPAVFPPNHDSESLFLFFFLLYCCASGGFSSLSPPLSSLTMVLLSLAHNNRVGDSGAAALAAALRENSSLTKLKCVLLRLLRGGQRAL